MSEEVEKEKSPAFDKNGFLAEIERLHIDGYATRKIAEMLGTDWYHVGRNLREIRKRWARAAARQKGPLAQTRCGTVYSEAMDGSRRSQNPKITSTEHLNKEKEVDGTVNRRQEGPGDKTFLQAAVAALKALGQFAEKQVDEPRKPREMTDREYVLLMQFLTQEQVDRLDDDQLQRIREAMDNLRAEIDASREEERLEEERRQAEDPCHHAAHAAELSGELAQQDPGQDSAANGNGQALVADGLHAAASKSIDLEVPQ
jgi:hypothetical protein